jgi:hypothetical protein
LAKINERFNYNSKLVLVPFLWEGLEENEEETKDTKKNFLPAALCSM